MKLSVIIPVFNEEKTISLILKKLAALEIPNVEKEIIVVDDGSTDATASVIQNLEFRIQNLKHIRHTKNQGKGAAIRAGLEKASGDYVIIQDADLEYNPKDIGKLVASINADDMQIIYGTRLKRLPNFKRDERTPRFLLHYLGNKFLSFLTSILYGQWITDMETGYKLFSKKSLDGIRLHAKRFDFEPEITAKLLKRGYRILEIPITTTPRGYSEGKKLNTIKDGFLALWTLLKYRFID